jgi:hypothetical protein
MRAATHQIPVVRTPENWMLADSTPILQLLDSRLGSATQRFYPAGLNGALAAVLEEYFDEWFARLAVFTRWTFFEENASSVDWPMRQVPAAAAAWGKRAVRATLGGTELQQEHGVKELQRVLGALNDHLEQQRRAGGSGRFIFGASPTARPMLSSTAGAPPIFCSTRRQSGCCGGGSTRSKLPSTARLPPCLCQPRWVTMTAVTRVVLRSQSLSTWC